LHIYCIFQESEYLSFLAIDFDIQLHFAAAHTPCTDGALRLQPYASIDWDFLQGRGCPGP
jgi:hypothetical protein